MILFYFIYNIIIILRWSQVKEAMKRLGIFQRAILMEHLDKEYNIRTQEEAIAFVNKLEETKELDKLDILNNWVKDNAYFISKAGLFYEMRIFFRLFFSKELNLKISRYSSKDPIIIEEYCGRNLYEYYIKGEETII